MSATLDVRCHTCYADPGRPCRSSDGEPRATRQRRALSQSLYDVAGPVDCPTCGASAGMDCWAVNKPHAARLTRAERYREAMAWVESLDSIAGLPVILVRVVRRNPTFPGAWIVGFFCPFCRREHTHGAHDEDFGAEPTSRVAHCDPGSPMEDYYLKVPRSAA